MDDGTVGDHAVQVEERRSRRPRKLNELRRHRHRGQPGRRPDVEQPSETDQRPLRRLLLRYERLPSLRRLPRGERGSGGVERPPAAVERELPCAGEPLELERRVGRQPPARPTSRLRTPRHERGRPPSADICAQARRDRHERTLALCPRVRPVISREPVAAVPPTSRGAI